MICVFWLIFTFICMKLVFLGDVMLGRYINELLKAHPSEYPWGDTLDIISSADARFCNLECAISNKGMPWNKTKKVFHFRSDTKNVAVLKKAGINCVSLANNHALDYGYDALLEMLDTLKDQNINCAGAGRDLEAAMHPAIFKVHNYKLGWLALTDNEPIWEATGNSPGTYFVPISLENRRYPELLNLIKKTKASVDILIVSVHWGPNWGYRPKTNHIPFAHSLIDSGADIIFGHSCHVFQGVEFYKNCPIIYSAGDFIDDYAVDPEERNDQSFIFLVEIKNKKITGLKLYPTIIKNFQVRHPKGDQAEIIANHMKSLCNEFGTYARWVPSQEYLELCI